MKKIIKRIAAIIFVAVFTISNIVMPVSAAFVGAASLPALFTLLAAVLVAAGINSQTEVDGMTRSDLLNSYSEHRQEIANKQFAEDWSDGWDIILDAVQNYVDTCTHDSEVITDNFGDWVQEHQDDVATKSGIDLKGYGAVAQLTDTSYAPCVYTEYCDYIVVSSDGSSGLCVNCHSFVHTSNLDVIHSLSGNFLLLSDKYYFSGDVRLEDGSPAYDYTEDEVPADIGTVIINGIEYPINDDGTVTIDGVTYTINDDGSLTVGDDTYYPDYDLPVYDDTAIIDLLNDILGTLDDATIPSDDTSTKDIIEGATPIAISDSDFSKLTMDKSISTVFPFCIPFDFYNGLKLLATKPVAPRFEVPFEIPQYGSFPGFKKMIVVDFAEYEKYFYVVRWGMFAISMFGMCFLTFKIVKGAR